MLDLQQALAEWGSTMEMPGLAPSAHDAMGGGVQLRFPGTDVLLGVMQQGDEVIVYRATPTPPGGGSDHETAALVLHAMRQAAQLAEPAQAVQVGLRSTATGDWLVLSTRFSRHGVSGARLHQAAEFLRQWLTQLEP